MDDFVIDTKARCFLCLDRVSPELTPIKLESASSPASNCYSNYSLQCLSRYLQMDRGKVFYCNGPTPPHLFAKVEKARLKVTLCDMCRCLNEQFSALFKELEKADLNLTSCLNLIRKQFLRGDDARKTEEFRSAMKGSCDGLFGKLEIVEALRTDAIKKCSQKLMKIQPRVKVQRLNEGQLASHFNSQKVLQQNMKTELATVKTELSSEDSFPDDFSENNDLEDPEFCPEAKPLDAQESVRNVWKRERSSSLSSKSFEGSKSVVSQKRGKVKRNICSKEYKSKSFEIHYNGNCTISKSPKKAPHPCPHCRKGYSRSDSLKDHIRTVHLKSPVYRCNQCNNKAFSSVGNLRKHVRTVHLDIREHQCNFCDKRFKHKKSMVEHRLKAHFLRAERPDHQ